MSIGNIARNFLPVSVRRWVKEMLGMPRWLHDDYALLRVVGELDQKHVVLDVGACHGWFSKCWLNYNPLAEVHCFEPTASVFRDHLEPAHAADERVTLVRAGVGSRKGSMQLNTAGYHKANSFLKLSENWVWGSDDSISFNDEEVVDVITLADYLKEKEISSVEVIKIDVQGFELEVLKGLDTYVDRVEYIYVETSIHPVYQEAPDFRDVFSFLAERGFKLLDIKTDRLGELWLSECDLLFKRIENRQEGNG